MGPGRLLRRRARAHLGLLVLVLVLTALTAASLTVTTGYTVIAADDGMRTALGQVSPRDGAVQYRTRLSDDPGAQQDAVADIVGTAFGDLPLGVHRTVRSLTLQASRPDGSPLGPVVLGADDELTARARVVAGTWPAAGDDAGDTAGAIEVVPAALQEDAAAALGLALGDTLTVTDDDGGSVVVEVAALWAATAPADPVWFDDPLVTAGADAEQDGAHGPVVVAEDVLGRLAGIDLVRWTVTPDLAALTPAELPAVRDGLATAAALFQEDDVAKVNGLVVDGGLGGTAGSVDASLTAVRGITASAALLVVLVALVVLSQVARLLGAVRGGETVVLRSRGASVGQLAGTATVEGLAVAVPGALVGAALALAGLRLLGEPSVAGAAGLALAVGVATTLVLGLTAAWEAGVSVSRGRSDAAGRSAAPVALGLLVLAAAGAGLAWWQLHRYGSPVFTGVDGRPHLDPLAVAAAPLALLVVALVAAALLAPLSRVAARRAAGRRGLAVSLTTRQLARSSVVYAVPTILVALTVATTAFVTGYAGSVQAHRAATVQAAVGADVRVVAGGTQVVEPGVGSAVPTWRAAAGVRAAVPVLTAGLLTGKDHGELVAMPAAGLRDVLLDPAGTLARGALTAALAPTGPAHPDDPAASSGPVLPDGAASVELSVDLMADVAPDVPAGALTARVWWTDADGTLAVQEAPLVPAPGSPAGAGAPRTQHLAATLGLPAASATDVAGSRRLAAVDVAPTAAVALTVEVTALDTVGPDGARTDLLAAPELASGWSAVVFDGRAVDVPVAAGRVMVDASTAARGLDGSPLRLLPGPGPAELPVVVTAAWARDFDLTTGATTTVRVAGRDLTARVVGTAVVVPGSAAALSALTDLSTLDAVLLRTGADVPRAAEVWVATDEPTTVAGGAAPGPDETVMTALPPAQPLSAPAAVAFWVAAVCALSLAVPGVGAAAIALARSRRPEVGVLRALGVGGAAQSRSRRAEIGWSLALAVLVGAVGGLAAVWLYGPDLVRATAGQGRDALPAPWHLHLTGGVALLAATVVVLVAVVLGYGRRVRAQARAASVREEGR